jgi:hypothetical protein
MAAAAVLFAPAASRADDIVRIEEDWRLVVSAPDADTVSPQATCTFAPVGNLSSAYAVFDLNLRNFPSYEAGGVQLQLWSGDASVEAVREKAGYTLQTEGETITWTQRMVLADGNLQFSVVNGNSQTWGSFGSASSLSVGTATDLENLNDYSPAVSVANSGVGFGANRVTSLVLVGIRAYSAAGLVGQDTTEHVVHPHAN